MSLVALVALAIFQASDPIAERVAALVPTAAEERFAAIPWETNLMRARRTAAAREVPLFVWMMNGHPLGCTLVDNVRGEPPMWSEKDVRALAVTATRRGDSFELVGAFDLRTADGKRGYVGTLADRFALDAQARSLGEWTLLAKGEAWGEGQWTAGAPAGHFPLAVAFVLPPADDVLARAIPPQAAACGLDYLAAR